MEFEKRLQIGIDFLRYLEINKKTVPKALRQRKKMFITWYIERNRKRRYSEVITELAHEILYIKVVTLERIIFNEK